MNLSRFELGLISLVLGSLILLYALNLLTSGMNFLFIATAIALIAWGLYSINAFPYIQNFISGIARKITSIFKKNK